MEENLLCMKSWVLSAIYKCKYHTIFQPILILSTEIDCHVFMLTEGLTIAQDANSPFTLISTLKIKRKHKNNILRISISYCWHFVNIVLFRHHLKWIGIMPTIIGFDHLRNQKLEQSQILILIAIYIAHPYL